MLWSVGTAWPQRRPSVFRLLWKYRRILCLTYISLCFWNCWLVLQCCGRTVGLLRNMLPPNVSTSESVTQTIGKDRYSYLTQTRGLQPHTVSQKPVRTLEEQVAFLPPTADLTYLGVMTDKREQEPGLQVNPLVITLGPVTRLPVYHPFARCISKSSSSQPHDLIKCSRDPAAFTQLKWLHRSEVPRVKLLTYNPVIIMSDCCVL